MAPGNGRKWPAPATERKILPRTAGRRHSSCQTLGSCNVAGLSNVLTVDVSEMDKYLQTKGLHGLGGKGKPEERSSEPEAMRGLSRFFLGGMLTLVVGAGSQHKGKQSCVESPEPTAPLRH